MAENRMIMEQENIQCGSRRAESAFRITVSSKGPILVFGRPPLAQQFIVPDTEGESREFVVGAGYATDDQPTALCRCGASEKKPYCDGSHIRAVWDPRLTASDEPLLDGARTFGGPTLRLTDNETFCVFARFCDAGGRVWNLVGRSDEEDARALTVREANMCPGGRLSAWENETGEPYEPEYAPSLGLIEDPVLGVSGGVWVRGGIPVRTQEGIAYEIRNRVVLCRCGASGNKPFCDGSHASVGFRDGLEPLPGSGR